MPRTLSDSEISDMLSDRKVVTAEWKQKMYSTLPKEKLGHSQRDLDVTGESGRKYHIFVRRNSNRTDDFSIGLQYVVSSSEEYTLVRVNGKSHTHTNKIEKKQGVPNSRFRGEFHIHKATERYQRKGCNIDGYAEISNDYTTFEEAIDYFLDAYGFEIDVPPPSGTEYYQKDLFDDN